MNASTVIEFHPIGDPGFGLTAVGVSLEIDVPMLSGIANAAR